ncbi:hypothetical protein [Gorillibacterium sp. sgz500922]|uniref:hypothetical protein n=1 Tax=Gorillibacterium sp. sgz500922 TaxID=3446694 RepID=UPI003F6665E4
MGNRAWRCAAAALVLSLALGGCRSGAAEEKGKIYSDPAKIAEAGDSFTFAHKEGKPDDKGGKLTYRGFNGAITLWTVEGREDSAGAGAKLKLVSKLQTPKGHAKLVYIHPDGTVQLLLEDQIESEVTVPAEKGTGRIKLVGQGARGSAEVTFTADDGIAVHAVEEME